MKIKFVHILTLTALAVIEFTLFAPGKVDAEDAATIFTQYTNPHAVCQWYRANGILVERESDSECLTSIGDGQFKTYTQFYYSKKNWCYKIIQSNKTAHENCVPVPASTFNVDKSLPYIIGGAVIFVIAVVDAAVLVNSKSKKLKKSGEGSYSAEESTTTEQISEPDTKMSADQVSDATDKPELKPKRHGRGSYGWKEMETSTTDTGEDMTKGPGEGQNQGGTGLHQGEPIVLPVASELEKLVKLRKQRSITQKEFNIAKKKLLK